MSNFERRWWCCNGRANQLIAPEETLSSKNRYQLLIEEIFFSHFSKGKTDFQFKREEIEKHAARLGIKLPKNLETSV